MAGPISAIVIFTIWSFVGLAAWLLITGVGLKEWFSDIAIYETICGIGTMFKNLVKKITFKIGLCFGCGFFNSKNPPEPLEPS
jgi:D-alanyl-lipoteichoic acid acyltransferase DltB (MBOAT superfamily)